MPISVGKPRGDEQQPITLLRSLPPGARLLVLGQTGDMTHKGPPVEGGPGPSHHTTPLMAEVRQGPPTPLRRRPSLSIHQPIRYT